MRILPLLILPLIGACTAVPQPSQPGTQPGRPSVIRPPVAAPPIRPVRPPTVGFRAPQVQRIPGLTGVIEQNAASIVRQFGQPRIDMREGDMRKLQFAGEACVLDVFLYPLRPQDEPVATSIEARRASDGQQVDQLACANTLRRR